MVLIYVGGNLVFSLNEIIFNYYYFLSRYDSQSHRLTDYPAEGHAHEIFPGQDYSNPRVKDFQSGKRKKKWSVINANKKKTKKLKKVTHLF